jgi:hypothetical protein
MIFYIYMMAQLLVLLTTKSTMTMIQTNGHLKIGASALSSTTCLIKCGFLQNASFKLEAWLFSNNMIYGIQLCVIVMFTFTILTRLCFITWLVQVSFIKIKWHINIIFSKPYQRGWLIIIDCRFLADPIIWSVNTECGASTSISFEPHHTGFVCLPRSPMNFFIIRRLPLWFPWSNLWPSITTTTCFDESYSLI